MSVKSIRGVKLESITKFFESFAPKLLAEKWDNTGLLVEPLTKNLVENILLTNDLTEDVIDEAIHLKVNLILSYHPPIFKPLVKLTSSSSWKERIICASLENKIAIYSPHTSFDSIPGGVNDWLAGAFEGTATPITKSSIFPNAGLGRFCNLKNPLKISEAVDKIKRLLSMQYLHLALARGASLETQINTIAICAGSGSSVLENVQADVFLTGEMSHHSLLNAIHNNTSVVLCNHSNSERGYLKEVAKILDKEFSADGVTIFLSEKDKDPLQIV